VGRIGRGGNEAEQFGFYFGLISMTTTWLSSPLLELLIRLYLNSQFQRVSPKPMESFTIEQGKDDDSDEPLERMDCCSRNVGKIQSGIGTFYSEYNNKIWILIYTVMLILYGCYFSYAMYYRFGDEGSIRLLGVTSVVVLCSIISVVNANFGAKIYEATLSPVVRFFKHQAAGKRIWRTAKWYGYSLVVVALCVWYK
jgi:hypothetical protein